MSISSQLKAIPAADWQTQIAFGELLPVITRHLDDPKDVSSVAGACMGLKERAAQEAPWEGVAGALQEIFPWADVDHSQAPIPYREHTKAYLAEFHSLMSDVVSPGAQSATDTPPTGLTIKSMFLVGLRTACSSRGSMGKSSWSPQGNFSLD